MDSYAAEFQTSFQKVLQAYRPELYQKTDMLQIMSSLISNDSTRDGWLREILNKASERARGTSLVSLLLNVWAEVLLSGPVKHCLYSHSSGGEVGVPVAWSMGILSTFGSYQMDDSPLRCP